MENISSDELEFEDDAATSSVVSPRSQEVCTVCPLKTASLHIVSEDSSHSNAPKDEKKSKVRRKSHCKRFPQPIEYMAWKLVPIDLDQKSSNIVSNPDESGKKSNLMLSESCDSMVEDSSSKDSDDIMIISKDIDPNMANDDRKKSSDNNDIGEIEVIKVCSSQTVKENKSDHTSEVSSENAYKGLIPWLLSDEGQATIENIQKISLKQLSEKSNLRLGSSGVNAACANGISTTANEILSSVNGISTTANEISSSVNGISTSVNGISTSVNGISTSVNGISTSVNGISASVNGISTSVNGTSTSVSGTSTSVSGISTNIHGATLEVKSEQKFYRDCVPFHKRVSGVPLGRLSVPNASQIIDIDDDRRDKSIPLASLPIHRHYVNVLENEKAPILPSSSQPTSSPISNIKFETDDKKIGFSKYQMRQANLVNEHQMIDKLNSSLNYSYSNNGGTALLNVQFQDRPSSQFQAQSQGPANATFQVQSSSQIPYNPTLVSRPVKEITTLNPFDSGLTLICHICTFKADSHFSVIEHYVNDHSREEPPCGLSTKLLNLVKREQIEPSKVKNKTGIKWIDDLNWIPNQRVFLEYIRCRMPDCGFSTNIRLTLIKHIRNHQEEHLKVPTKRVHSDYECIICCTVIPDAKQFYEHCTRHTGEYMFGCGYCSTRSHTIDRLKHHHNNKHEKTSFIYKKNVQSTIDASGVVYGYACTVCGFVQLNKSTVERHAKNHPPSKKATEYKFDFARQKKRPEPPPQPSKPPQVPMTILSSKTKNQTARKHSAPVKIRGDPRTTVSRQEMLTQLIPAEGRKPATSAVIVETTDTQSDGPQVSIEQSTQETAATVSSEPLSLSSLLENNMNEANLEPLIEHRNESDCEYDNGELAIDFEAVAVKPERTENVSEIMDDAPERMDDTPERMDDAPERMDDAPERMDDAPERMDDAPERMEDALESSAADEMSFNPLVQSTEVYNSTHPTQTLGDTISRLKAQIATNTLSIASCSSQSSTSFMSIIASATNILDKQQVDWNERKKSILCNCLSLTQNLEAFILHCERVHSNSPRRDCFECFNTFDSSIAYVNHRWSTCAKINLRIYVCKAESSCRFLTSEKSKFEDHVICEHPSIEWLSCYWCSSKFTTGCALTNHISNCKSRFLIRKLNQCNDGPVNDSPVALSLSLEDTFSPQLKVVYLCPVQRCSHQSLERRVFLEHMVTVHETEKESVCKYCDLNLGHLNNLVVHMEENHQDEDRRRTVQPMTKSMKNSQSSLSSRLDRIRSDLSISPSRLPSLTTRLPPRIPIIEDENWLPGETEREYELTSFDDAMIKRVSHSFHLNGCNSRPGVLEKKLQEWRMNKINYNPPDISDPVQFINTLKTADALRAISTPLKLRHLYKCSGSNCCFTSDDEREFREHLMRKTCMLSTALYCIYCGKSHKSVTDLTSHINIKHGQCIFQCPHCIFRAKKVVYVLFHLAKKHPEHGRKAKVLKCLSERAKCSNIDDEVPELFTIIHPVSCINDCPFVSLDAAAFLEHHSSAHSQMAHVICFLCSARVSRENFECHLKLHKVFENHCEICGYGSDSLSEVILHNCLVHPERNVRILLRKLNLLPSPESGHQASGGSSKSFPNTTINRSCNPSTPAFSLPPNVEEKAALATSQSSTAVVPCGKAVLKKCGFQLCKYFTSVISELSTHMDTCSMNQETSRLYCSQCFGSCKTKQELIEHLNGPVESQVYYFCGVCNFRSPLTSTIKTHLETIHNLQFKQTNCEARPREGESISDWVFNPSPVKMVISKSSTGILKSIISSNSRNLLADKDSVDLTKRKVSARDRSNLPSKEIFDQDVFCAECDLGFKVRKNMIIHLDQHFKPPESVFASCRRNSNDSTNEIWRPEHVPQFVPISQRFICSFSDCTHRSANSDGLDIHISIVHENPPSIPCAHCSTMVDNLADLHRHLELHGPVLYQCSLCRYINSHRNIVRGHSMGEHNGIPPNVEELRNITEDVGDTTLSVEANDGEIGCPCCPDFRCHSVMTLRKHLIENLSLIKYTCNICQRTFAKATDLQVHCGVHDGRDDFTENMTTACEDFINKTINFETNKRRRDASLQVPQNGPSSTQPPPLANNTGHSLPATVSSKSTKSTSHMTKKKQKNSNKTTLPTSSTDFRYNCPSCPFSCTNDEHFKLAQHLRTIHLKALPKFNCGHCDKTFEAKHIANQHHNAVHSLTMDKKIVEKKDEMTETFIEWVIMLLKNIDGGDKVHRPIPLICNVGGCQENFTNIYLFKTHFFNHITTPSETGDKSSSAAKVCQRMDKSVKPSSSLPSCVMCPFCNYVSDRNMGAHIYSHYDYRFFKCAYCDYDAKCRSQVRNHVKSTHPSKPLVVLENKKPENVVITETINSDGKSHGRTFVRVTAAEDEPREKPEEELEVFRCSGCPYFSKSVINIRYHCQNVHDLAKSIIIGKKTNVKNRSAKAVATPKPVAVSNRARNADSSGISSDKNEGSVDTASANKEEYVECTECGEQLENLSHWLIHFNQKHASNTRKRKQKQSAKKTPSSDGDGVNIDETQNIKSLAEPQKATDKYKTSFKCGLCDFASANQNGIKAHWKQFHRNEPFQFKSVKNAQTYNCFACPFKTPNLKEGRIHIKKIHCTSYSCNKCKKVFANLHFLRIHNSKVHGVGTKLDYACKPTDAHAYNELIRAMLNSRSKSKTPTTDNVEDAFEKSSMSRKSEEKSDIDDRESDVNVRTNHGDESKQSSKRCSKSTREVKSKDRKKFPEVRLRPKKRRSSDEIYEFSYYKRKPDPIDWSKLTVNTNLKGYRNATISAIHLREIFNIDAFVTFKDLYK